MTRDFQSTGKRLVEDLSLQEVIQIPPTAQDILVQSKSSIARAGGRVGRSNQQRTKAELDQGLSSFVITKNCESSLA